MVFDTVTWGMCAVSGLTLAVHAWTLKRWARGWKLAAQATASVEAPTQANFGIVIPCRNEEDRLPHLLDDLVTALRSNPALSHVLVVVVDDWSDDQTASLARRHALQPHVVSMQEHSSTPNEGGKKAALLAGLEVLNTTWAVTLDADVRLQPEWGSAWLQALASQPERCAAVAGPVRLWDGQNTGMFGEVLALDYAAQMGWSAAQITHGRPASASGANLAVRRSAYPDTRHLGPSGDDALVLQTLSNEGWGVEWMGDTRGTVSTPAPPTWRQTVQQQLRWAGKAGHYLPHVKRTALWVAWTAVCPWMWLTFGILSQDKWGAVLAVGFWLGLTAHNVAFVAPVAKWFGLSRKPWLWLGLACLQPVQVPVLALARLGLLRPFGIQPKPTWKGRTCTP